ncbi:Uncharacterised protein [uncultured archaeon]|nr:Uncharacterised protein [uncultured archaeon]
MNSFPLLTSPSTTTGPRITFPVTIESLEEDEVLSGIEELATALVEELEEESSELVAGGFESEAISDEEDSEEGEPTEPILASEEELVVSGVFSELSEEVLDEDSEEGVSEEIFSEEV